MLNVIAEEYNENSNVIGLGSEHMQMLDEKRKDKEKVIDQILKENFETFDMDHGPPKETLLPPIIIIEVLNGPSNVKKNQ